MPKFKRVVLSAVAGVLASLALAVPAHAVGSDGVKGDCVLAGKAKATVPLSGGKGTYGFTQLTFVCVGVEVAKGVPNAGTLQVNVTTAGKFENIICGTGKAADADPIVNVTVLASAAPFKSAADLQARDWAYHIDFAMGQGTLYFTSGDINANKGIPHNTPPKLLDGLTSGEKSMEKGYLGGAISIQPDPVTKAAPGPGICTNGFVVEGDVVVDTMGV